MKYAVKDEQGRYGSKMGWKIVSVESPDMAYVFETREEAEGFARYCEQELKRPFQVVVWKKD